MLGPDCGPQSLRYTGSVGGSRSFILNSNSEHTYMSMDKLWIIHSSVQYSSAVQCTGICHRLIPVRTIYTLHVNRTLYHILLHSPIRSWHNCTHITKVGASYMCVELCTVSVGSTGTSYSHMRTEDKRGDGRLRWWLRWWIGRTKLISLERTKLIFMHIVH